MNILSDIKSKVQTKELILEWIFIIILCMGIVIYYEKFYIKYSSVTGISVVILLNILKFCDKDDESIFGNRKSIFTFILAYIITLYPNKIFIYLLPFIGSIFTLTFVRIIIIILPIFSCYFWKIKLRDFNWKLSFKWLAIIIVIFFALLMPELYKYGTSLFMYRNFSSLFDYIFNIVMALIFNAGFEEIIFRGFLISALKSFQLSDTKVNIIQSILFGIPHLYLVSSPLGICWHILIGYILGKVYLNSKSLTPGIILHLLINWV
ncbi:CPBP family intramembrane glutamic endopeptidase [Clostridium nigeriense]|uniref:CPBP family intramembrane glutamic endopeptidase n=1 Tax=Clostridium nigeriense TaxID=1805470 RepID=UPI003D343DD4